MPASRSKTFRKMAADALRAGRKTQPGDAREAHFDTAAPTNRSRTMTNG